MLNIDYPTKGNIEVPICVPCIDSFTLSIPLKYVEFIDKKMTSEIVTYYVDIDELDDEVQKPKPYIYEKNGIRIRFWIRKMFNGTDGTPVDFLGITVISKLLTTRYFQGFTRSNTILAYEHLMAMNVVKFSYENFLNSPLTDVDICYNFRVKPLLFLDLVSYYESILKQGCDRFFQKHRHVTRDGEIKNLGLSFNDRHKSTPARPYAKFYYKKIELEGKSKDFYEKYLLHHVPDINNLFRLEYTIKSFKHKDRLLKKGYLKRNFKSLSDLLHFSKDELKKVCLSFHFDYMKREEDKIVFTAVNDLPLADRLICDYMTKLIQLGTPKSDLFTILNTFGDSDAGRKKKSRLKSKINKLLDHVENNSLSVKNQLEKNTELNELRQSLIF